MKFILIDRITRIEPPTRIVATKSLSLAEEYLADHFPTFPVMPGVLMLEALVQAASWLVRVVQDFRHSVVVLGEARNVNYKSFVSPGKTLEVTAEALNIGEAQSEFRASGHCGGQEIVKARLWLRHYNLADHHAGMAEIDEKLVSDARRRFELLGGPAACSHQPATAGGH
jgi:3-hydroxyacyl-[acyl-carrier-protein] dehydratase